MKVGIVGAGFAGLAAAYYLSKNGHEVSVFEKDEKPGGLAVGYREKEWEWSLERHYHHWFANDYSVLNLAKEIKHNVILRRPKTSALINGSIYQLDSPLTLIQFPLLSFPQKIRMGIALAFLKYNPFWKQFDKYKAQDLLPKMMGEEGFKMIWAPLFKAKFNDFARDISLAWFWARIRKRTESLMYPEGGFLSFTERLQKEIEKNGGKFYYNTEVKQLSALGGQLSGAGSPVISFSVSRATNRKPENRNPKTENREPITEEFDAVIVTLPSFLFLKIAQDLPSNYKSKLSSLKSLGATNLLLRLKKPFLVDGTYWLNVCEPNSPLMAVVEHTNFMDKKHYNEERLVYIGHYVERTHPYFSATADELLKKFDPYLKKLNKDYRKNLIDIELFKAPFAQPVMPVNYSNNIPPFETPLPNVYLANIDQVYPWDRGTNYAVGLGIKVAKLVVNEN